MGLFYGKATTKKTIHHGGLKTIVELQNAKDGENVEFKEAKSYVTITSHYERQQSRCFLLC